MKLNNETICNVCLLKSSENSSAVFISARKAGEEIDICTACMPTIIHGSGEAAKSNEQVRAELNL